MNAISRKAIFGVTVVFLILAMLPALTLAEWPERPEDDPTPTPSPSLPKDGAGIALSVTGATAPYYAVVQWQNGLEGWRGEVENDTML